MTLEEVAEKYGLTSEGVDYALAQYQIVLCEISHGMLSKLSYDAKDVIRISQERWCDTCDLKEQEPVTWSHEYTCFECSNCGLVINDEVRYLMNKTINFCPVCGRKVKWDD